MSEKERRQPKIRTDYVPKVKQKGHVLKTAKKTIVTQLCPKCNMAIPIDEMQEHIRIELLDPKWREQKQRAIEKQQDSNLIDKGSIIMHNLKRLSEFRTDIFTGDDEAARKKMAEQQTKAKEKAIWDGFAASAASVTTKVGTATFEEEVEKFRENLRATEAIGPRVPGLSAEDIFFGKLVQHPLPPKPSSSIQESEYDRGIKRSRFDEPLTSALPGFIPESEFLSQNPFPISIKIFSSKKSASFPLSYSSIFVNSTVSSIKSRIHQDTNIPMQHIQIIMKHKGDPVVLKDRQTLAFYNIYDGCALEVTH